MSENAWIDEGQESWSDWIVREEPYGEPDCEMDAYVQIILRNSDEMEGEVDNFTWSECGDGTIVSYRIRLS